MSAKTTVRTATLDDVAAVSALSRLDPDVHQVTTQEVESLLHQGPACVAVTRDQIVGYGLTRTSVPGVVETVGLRMPARSPFGDTEASIIRYLELRSDLYGQDGLMVVYAGEPKRGFSSSFFPVLADMSFRLQLKLGPDEGIELLGKGFHWESESLHRFPGFSYAREVGFELPDAYAHYRNDEVLRGQNPSWRAWPRADELSIGPNRELIANRWINTGETFASLVG